MAIHSCWVVKATGKNQKSQYLNVLHHETEKERKYVVIASENIIQVEDETLPVLNFAPVPNGTELDGKVLSFCYLKAHKVSEIAGHLGISDSTYLRKQILGNMEKNGYLEKSKVSRATYYKTNPDVVTVI